MIIVKSEREIELMRRAGKITAAARALAGEMVKPGVTTREIDKAVFHFIRSQGAEPSFLNYNGYPASVCVSVNDEIIHGIPGPRVLKEGDIVSVDVGAYIGGFHGDCAATYPCGKISEEAQRLIDVTRQSFFEGFAQAREGNRISDISHAVQAYVEANGFSVVREYVGHGGGRNMHEAPEIPNYGAPGHGPKLLRGMTIAVEPMVNAGTAAIRQMSDGWTVKTRDGKYAAHATGFNIQLQTLALREHDPHHRRRARNSDGSGTVRGRHGHCESCSGNCRQRAGQILLRAGNRRGVPAAGRRQEPQDRSAEAEKAKACPLHRRERGACRREDQKQGKNHKLSAYFRKAQNEFHQDSAR